MGSLSGSWGPDRRISGEETRFLKSILTPQAMNSGSVGPPAVTVGNTTLEGAPLLRCDPSGRLLVSPDHVFVVMCATSDYDYDARPDRAFVTEAAADGYVAQMAGYDGLVRWVVDVPLEGP